MGNSEQDVEVEQRVRLGRALKTTARDVLFLVFEKRFPAHHPGAKPIDVLMKNSKASSALKRNATMRKILTDNRTEEFDITILHLMLNTVCGLSRVDSVWKDTTTLEGNIEIIHKLRNDDGHWTKHGCPEQNLRDDWDEMEVALTTIIRLSGLDSHFPKMKEELRNIRKGAVPHGDRIRGRVREELKKLYKSGKKTSLQPLVWAGPNFSFHHSVLSTYTPGRITTIRDGEVTEMTAEDVLVEGRKGSSRVIVMQGDCGTGKTSLLRHYAASWAADTPSSDYDVEYLDYLLLMDLTAVTRHTFTMHDVIHELLPKACTEWKPVTIIKELTRSGDKVLFLIDAFDERHGAFYAAFRQLLNKCPEATFIVATRPHCTQFIIKLCGIPASVVTIHGFSRKRATEYASRLLQQYSRENELEAFINAVSPYEEILTIPQLLCWSLWLWLEQREDHFLTRGKVFSVITDCLLRKLCHISDKRVMSAEIPSEGQKWLDLVAELAFTLAQTDQTFLTQTSDKIKKLQQKAKTLGLPSDEALSTFMQCYSNMTGTGEHLVYQFVHESLACFLAAHHLASTLRDGSLRSNLEKVMKMKRKQILLFVVKILYSRKEQPREPVVDKVASVAKKFVKFYDINYYLDLIEESGRNKKLTEVLARNIPEQINNTQPVSQHGVASHKRPPTGCLWLRPKELRRNDDLLELLKFYKPGRVWLRLCEGPHDDPLHPVSGFPAMKGDVSGALNLLAEAYHNGVLTELILTDCTLTNPASWPSSIWWLTLQRCVMESDISVPRGLLKLKLTECRNIDTLRLAECDTIVALCVESCSFTRQFQFPPQLQYLTISCCSEVAQLYLPNTVKRLALEGCDVPKLPPSLKRLQVTLPIKGKEEISVWVRDSNCVIQNVHEATQKLSHLQDLIITNVRLHPLAFPDVLRKVEISCPRCNLEVKSCCLISDDNDGDDDDERLCTTTAVNSSALPSVKVMFGKELFCKDLVKSPQGKSEKRSSQRYMKDYRNPQDQFLQVLPSGTHTEASANAEANRTKTSTTTDNINEFYFVARPTASREPRLIKTSITLTSEKDAHFDGLSEPLELTFHSRSQLTGSTISAAPSIRKDHMAGGSSAQALSTSKKHLGKSVSVKPISTRLSQMKLSAVPMTGKTEKPQQSKPNNGPMKSTSQENKLAKTKVILSLSTSHLSTKVKADTVPVRIKPRNSQVKANTARDVRMKKVSTALAKPSLQRASDVKGGTTSVMPKSPAKTFLGEGKDSQRYADPLTKWTSQSNASKPMKSTYKTIFGKKANTASVRPTYSRAPQSKLRTNTVQQTTRCATQTGMHTFPDLTPSRGSRMTPITTSAHTFTRTRQAKVNTNQAVSKATKPMQWKEKTHTPSVGLTSRNVQTKANTTSLVSKPKMADAATTKITAATCTQQEVKGSDAASIAPARRRIRNRRSRFTSAAKTEPSRSASVASTFHRNLLTSAPQNSLKHFTEVESLLSPMDRVQLMCESSKDRNYSHYTYRCGDSSSDSDSKDRTRGVVDWDSDGVIGCGREEVSEWEREEVTEWDRDRLTDWEREEV